MSRTSIGCHPSINQSRAFKGMWGPSTTAGHPDEVECQSPGGKRLYYLCSWSTSSVAGKVNRGSVNRTMNTRDIEPWLSEEKAHLGETSNQDELNNTIVGRWLFALYTRPCM